MGLRSTFSILRIGLIGHISARVQGLAHCSNLESSYSNHICHTLRIGHKPIHFIQCFKASRPTLLISYLMEWASPIIAPVLTQNRLVKSLGKLHFRSPCASKVLNHLNKKKADPLKNKTLLPKGLFG